MSKTATERKADERARMRALGFVVYQFYLHPADRARVLKYLRRVNDRRKPK